MPAHPELTHAFGTPDGHIAGAGSIPESPGRRSVLEGLKAQTDHGLLTLISWQEMVTL